jgi:hypothetical protein
MIKLTEKSAISRLTFGSIPTMMIGGKPHDAAAFRGEFRWSDASGLGTLKWQIAARPLTIY